MRRTARVSTLLLGLGLLFSPDHARANGAFPDSFSIFAPAGTQRIIVATTFGLLTSDDDGATWKFICEVAISPNAFLYQVSAKPPHLMLGVSFTELAVSADRGCTWSAAGGALADKEVVDAFPDPSDSMHVLALARVKTPTGTFSLYESVDGAMTFPRVLHESAPMWTLQSVEIAKTDPQIIYATEWTEFPPHPYVMTSTNGGTSFATTDAAPAFGRHVALIAAVDPEDARKIYFRVLSTSNVGDSLGISEDGGRTFRILVDLPIKMRSFLRRSDGALIIGTDDGAQISTNGGASFEPWMNAPRLRGLAERDGAIYGATSNFLDGYGVGVTRDGGRTWTPLLRFESLRDILACGGLPESCAQALINLQLTLEVPPVNTDGGTPPPPPPPPPPPSMSDGCGCNTARGDVADVFWGLILIAAISVRRR